MNIIEMTNGKSQFSTLVTAIKAAGLVDALSGVGPFTVFAPTNDAFAKLPKGTVEDLVKPENKVKLTNLLKLHVLTGKHMAGEYAGKSVNVATLGGEKIEIKGNDGRVTAGGAKLATADMVASNGVIHGMDSVLIAA